MLSVVGGQARVEAVDRHLARDLTGEVAAHAVGDDEQPVADVEVVLVLGADLALVGGRTPAQIAISVAPPSLGLQHGVADLEAVADPHGSAVGELGAVQVRAVARTQVVDHDAALQR